MTFRLFQETVVLRAKLILNYWTYRVRSVIEMSPVAGVQIISAIFSFVIYLRLRFLKDYIQMAKIWQKTEADINQKLLI